MGLFVLGNKAKLYYSPVKLDTRPSDPTPVNTVQTVTWNEIKNVRDVTIQADAEFVDTTTREDAETGWTSEAAVIKSGQLQFQMQWNPGQAAFDAILAAYLARDTIALLELDGDKATNDKQGLAGNWAISMSFTQPVKDVQRVDVTCRINSLQDWVKVVGGVLVPQ